MFIKFKSDKIYNSLLDKVEELNRIICRYPFTSEVRFDNAGVVEVSMLVLYAVFPVAYMYDYSPKDMKRIVENGVHELSLHSTTYPPEIRSQESLLFYEEIVGTIRTAERKAMEEGEDIFDYIASCYIAYIFKWEKIKQKITEPSFLEAYFSMHYEMRDFWKRFCKGKWNLS